MIIPLTKDRDVIDALPFQELSSHEEFSPNCDTGISKYRSDLGKARLDSLFINKNSEYLIVSCHGALPRKTTVLPRFERLRTFLDTDYSSIYFGDPTLHLSEQLGLGWYTGWLELDLYPILAEWVQRAADASGASKIIFVGSSGGGFASLQISAHIPRSLAVPLNPQSAISKYQPQGSLGYSRNYVKNVMPHLTPEGGVKLITAEVDWSEPLGARASAITRYQSETANYVLYAQNLNDVSHRTDHYDPFRRATENGPNKERIHYYLYEGQHTHTSPKPDVFQSIMTEAIALLRNIS